MKAFIALAAVLILPGCASPTLKMTDQEIARLDDQSLCNYHNNYGPDMRRDAEINRRRLICDPYVRRCMAQGNQPGTEAMNYCVELLRENQRLRDSYHHDPFWYGVGGPHYRGHYHRHGGGIGIGVGL